MTLYDYFLLILRYIYINVDVIELDDPHRYDARPILPYKYYPQSWNYKGLIQVDYVSPKDQNVRASMLHAIMFECGQYQYAQGII